MNGVFHARGKLLLTAEYFVLDGAQALAIPVKYGQSLTVSPNPANDHLRWQSFDDQGQCWFEVVFQQPDFEMVSYNDEAVAKRLQSIFQQIKKQNPDLPTANCHLRTDLTFPRNWGLGTSSTLIYLLAQWAGVDPFQLQFATFGGSGYDIACAGAKGPILYQKENGQARVEPCSFDPPFAEQLYFVFLGKKQNSRKGIQQYRAVSDRQNSERKIAPVSALTQQFLQEQTLDGFEKLIIDHEKLVGDTIGLPRAKHLYFNDFWGEIKSLGAWGGDFVLATSNRTQEETRQYFNEKGFDVFLPYKDI